jgi:hypothetical protein
VFSRIGAPDDDDAADDVRGDLIVPRATRLLLLFCIFFDG